MEKSTGIVRRIDDLGRVVIPKEIRRNLNIKEGDPLELWVDGKNIVLKRYATSTESIADECAKLAAAAVKNGYLLGTYMDGDNVTVFTPKGKATATKNPHDAYDLNVAVCAALAKLGYLKMPDGLN